MMEMGEGAPEPVSIGNETKKEATCTVEAKNATTTKINIPSTVMNVVRLHAFIIVLRVIAKVLHSCHFLSSSFDANVLSLIASTPATMLTVRAAIAPISEIGAHYSSTIATRCFTPDSRGRKAASVAH